MFKPFSGDYKVLTHGISIATGSGTASSTGLKRNTSGSGKLSA